MLESLQADAEQRYLRSELFIKLSVHSVFLIYQKHKIIIIIYNLNHSFVLLGV